MPMDPLTRKKKLEQKRKPVKSGKKVPGQTPGPKGGPKVKKAS